MSTALAILKLIDIIALGASMAPDVLARYQKVQGLVKTMIEEDRDPSPEEIAFIDAETDGLLNDIANS